MRVSGRLDHIIVAVKQRDDVIEPSFHAHQAGQKQLRSYDQDEAPSPV